MCFQNNSLNLMFFQFPLLLPQNPSGNSQCNPSQKPPTVPSHMGLIGDCLASALTNISFSAITCSVLSRVANKVD